MIFDNIHVITQYWYIYFSQLRTVNLLFIYASSSLYIIVLDLLFFRFHGVKSVRFVTFIKIKLIIHTHGANLRLLRKKD